MDNTLLKITNLLTSLLETNCPVLSGNMKAHLEVLTAKPDEVVVCISAPFYDIKEWERTGNIIYTGSPKKWSNFTDYAMWVNKNGAFSKGNKSQYWVNRSCVSAVSQVANEIGAIVKNEL